jgi:hypothetical protein
VWCTDHLILSRPTAQGHTAIIIFCDAFSKWTAVKLVKTIGAVEAAQTFTEKVIANSGLPDTGTLILHSDKGSAYCSDFFRATCKLLNVRLITSGGQISRSNGQPEVCVRSTKQLLRVFADNDLNLERTIPFVELSFRAFPHSGAKIAPCKIMLGRDMNITGLPHESAHSAFRGDQEQYYNFIVQRLKEIHAGVKENLIEAKEGMRSNMIRDSKHKM